MLDDEQQAPTAPPSAPSGGGITNWVEALEKQKAELLKQRGEVEARIAQQAQQREADAQQQIAPAEEMAKRPMPQRPAVPKLPEAPNLPQMMEPSGLQQTLAISMVLANAFASHGKKGGLSLNALQSYTGFMQGMRSGQLERAQLALKQYEIDFDKLVKTHKMEMDDYNATIGERKLSLDEQMHVLKLKALKWQNQDMINKIDLGQYDKVLNDLNRQTTAVQRAAEQEKKDSLERDKYLETVRHNQAVEKERAARDAAKAQKETQRQQAKEKISAAISGHDRKEAELLKTKPGFFSSGATREEWQKAFDTNRTERDRLQRQLDLVVAGGEAPDLPPSPKNNDPLGLR